MKESQENLLRAIDSEIATIKDSDEIVNRIYLKNIFKGGELKDTCKEALESIETRLDELERKRVKVKVELKKLRKQCEEDTRYLPGENR